MKTSFLLRLALLTVGLTSGAFAQERKSYPPITFAVPGSNTTMTSKDRFVVLVIESAYLSHEGTAIPPDNVIDYLNTTMAANEAPYLAVHYLRQRRQSPRCPEQDGNERHLGQHERAPARAGTR